MIGRIVDFSLSLTGKQRLTLELDEDFRNRFDDLKEKDLNIELKQFHKKRSLEANRYAWTLIDKIAAKTRVAKTEVYRNAIREIGGVSDIVSIQTRAVAGMKKMWQNLGTGWQAEELDSEIPGWTNLILYKGSSTFNSEQMSRLIDSLVQDAKQLGIETRPQEEIDSLLREVRNA